MLFYFETMRGCWQNKSSKSTLLCHEKVSALRLKSHSLPKITPITQFFWNINPVNHGVILWVIIYHIIRNSSFPPPISTFSLSCKLLYFFCSLIRSWKFSWKIWSLGRIESWILQKIFQKPHHHVIDVWTWRIRVLSHTRQHIILLHQADVLLGQAQLLFKFRGFLLDGLGQQHFSGGGH